MPADLTRRPRIAVVTETFPPEVNGVARTVGLMVEWLLEQRYSVELVRPRQAREPVRTPHTGLTEVLTAGVRIPGYPQLQIGLPAFLRLRRHWSALQPDFVHIVTEGPLGWAAVAAAHALKIPLTSDFHTNFHRYAEHYGAALVGRSIAAYLRWLHNRTACTVVPTQEMKQELDNLGFERVLLAGRGVDSKLFHPAARSRGLRRQWGCGDDELVVLSVGRLAPEKALDEFAATARNLRFGNGTMRIVIVGDGPLRRQLERRYPDVHFAGERHGSDLAVHYASADLFLFPSTTETFGNVVLEAMASGLAVVAYDEAAAKQHIIHAESGLLAAVGEKGIFNEMAGLAARDRELRRGLALAAREAVLPLTWDRAFRELEGALLDSLASTRLGDAATHTAS